MKRYWLCKVDRTWTVAPFELGFWPLKLSKAHNLTPSPRDYTWKNKNILKWITLQLKISIINAIILEVAPWDSEASGTPGWTSVIWHLYKKLGNLTASRSWSVPNYMTTKWMLRCEGHLLLYPYIVSQNSGKYDNQLTKLLCQTIYFVIWYRKVILIPPNTEIQLLQRLVEGDSPVQVIVNHPILIFHEKWRAVRTSV